MAEQKKKVSEVIENGAAIAERCAEQIRAIDQAIKALNDGPLTRRAIVALIREVSGVSKQTIEYVLDGIEGLRTLLK